MEEAIILTRAEYNDLLGEIRSAYNRADLAEHYQYQAQCAACEAQEQVHKAEERIRRLKDYFNRPAYDALENMHRKELLQWCEEVGRQYNEQDDLQEWIAYCDKKYNKRHYQKLLRNEMRNYVSPDNDGYYEPSAPDDAYADAPYAEYPFCFWKFSRKAHINRYSKTYILNDLYFYHNLLTYWDCYYDEAKEFGKMCKYAREAYSCYKEIRALSEKLDISNPVDIDDYPSLIFATDYIKEAADDEEAAWYELMAEKYN